ncbi:MAG: PLDc N-terminal domain-containing protein, partial [Sphingomonadaceae bacterium]
MNHLSQLFGLAFAVYLLIVTFLLILENRRPQSTYAWMLAFTIMPVLGVILYLFTGRGWKAFSQERKLADKVLGKDFSDKLRNRMPDLDEVVSLLSADEDTERGASLLRLVAHNAGSALTAYNDAEILQDADEFYPRLLEDLRKAQHHIHLQYYIWTDDDFTKEVKDVLIERARAGVRVRALYDASSKSMLSSEYINDLKEAGVQLLPYLAYNSLRTLHLANYRCHRKITVID